MSRKTVMTFRADESDRKSLDFLASIFRLSQGAVIRMCIDQTMKAYLASVGVEANQTSTVQEVLDVEQLHAL